MWDDDNPMVAKHLNTPVCNCRALSETVRFKCTSDLRVAYLNGYDGYEATLEWDALV